MTVTVKHEFCGLSYLWYSFPYAFTVSSEVFLTCLLLFTWAFLLSGVLIVFEEVSTSRRTSQYDGVHAQDVGLEWHPAYCFPFLSPCFPWSNARKDSLSGQSSATNYARSPTYVSNTLYPLPSTPPERIGLKI